MTDTESYANDLGTLLWCEPCEDYILRSRRLEHPHTLVEKRPTEENVELDEDREEEYALGGDEPMEVGGLYRVEKSYEYRVVETVVATDNHIAKDLVDSSEGHITHELHTTVDQLDTYYEDDPEAEEHDLLP